MIHPRVSFLGLKDLRFGRHSVKDFIFNNSPRTEQNKFHQNRFVIKIFKQTLLFFIRKILLIITLSKQLFK